MTQSRRLFETELRPQAAALLTQVETLSGKKVSQEGWHAENLWSKLLAKSDFYEDGTPWIRLNEKRVVDCEQDFEDTIVHELFHLSLTLRGFPVLFVRFPSNDPDVGEYLQVVSEVLGNVVHHCIFYPSMREMGFKPELTDLLVLEKRALLQDKIYAQGGTNSLLC